MGQLCTCRGVGWNSVRSAPHRASGAGGPGRALAPPLLPMEPVQVPDAAAFRGFRAQCEAERGWLSRYSRDGVAVWVQPPSPGGPAVHRIKVSAGPRPRRKCAVRTWSGAGSPSTSLGSLGQQDSGGLAAAGESTATIPPLGGEMRCGGAGEGPLE